MKLTLTTAIVILLVAFAVLTGVQVAVQSVDVESIPAEYKQVWLGVIYIFSTSAVTPLWVFVRNIYGYLTNYYGAKPSERANIQYEANQLSATWLQYEGYIKGLTILMIALFTGTQLAPYAVYIAGASAFVLDLIRKSLADIGQSKTT